jgi:septal ring factor EnvC (AmiA/AmiB activator)
MNQKQIKKLETAISKLKLNLAAEKEEKKAVEKTNKQLLQQLQRLNGKLSKTKQQRTWLRKELRKKTRSQRDRPASRKPA